MENAINSKQTVQQMRVSAHSNVNKTAGSIVKHYEEGKEIEMITVGAGALNQAQKAINTASSILASRAVTIYERSGFDKVEIDGAERTAIIKRLIFQKG